MSLRQHLSLYLTSDPSPALLVLCWAALFVFLRFVVFRRLSFDFSNRAVSLVHVLVAVALCTQAIDFSAPFHSIGKTNTPGQVRAMLVSTSYFIYDLFCCLLDPHPDVVITIHHAVTILGLHYGLCTHFSGAELVLCLWLMELSNPFMHARQMMRELGWKGTPLAAYNDICFAVSFTIARMMVGPFLVWFSLIRSPSIPVKVGAVGIQVVSMFWFMKIVQAVIGKRRREQKID